MIHSFDGHAVFFDIIAEVLQGDRLALFLFKTCLGYVQKTSVDLMKENGIIQKKNKNKNKKQTIYCRNNDRRRLRR